MNLKNSFAACVLMALSALGLASAQAETYDSTEFWPVAKETCTVGKPLSFVMPEEGEQYFKLSGVSNGGEYSFFASGSNVYVEVVYTYSYTDRYEEGGKSMSDTYIEYDAIGFDSGDANWYVDEESWDEIIIDPTGATEQQVKPKAYYLYVAGDEGTTYSVSSAKGIAIPGTLTVRTKGADDATWSLKGEKASHKGGESISIVGRQTVVFGAVKGLKTPASQDVLPTQEGEAIEITGTYTDTYDPNDDTAGGAAKITPSAKVGAEARTLYEDDPADHFAFAAKEGSLYSFSFAALKGDAVMTLFPKGAESAPVTNRVRSISALSLKKGDYILRVEHGETATDSSYTLESQAVSVGTVGFAKTAVSAKKSAGTVALSVARSSGEGKVRVRYGTVNGTAKPGVDYYAQQGELVWENGDKKAKTITVRLIPEAFAEEALSRRFAVMLEPVGREKLEEGEYQAVLAEGKDVAFVTVTEAKAKAPAEPKTATVKTEAVPLETGTFQGVVAAEEGSLTNGFPALASVAFTAKNAEKKALSAKVTLGGKTYSFAADAWSRPDAATAVAVLTQLQKVDKTTLTNELTVVAACGETTTEGDWTNAVASVRLVMNVPDAKGKGYQAGVVYEGEIYRDNSKIQGYLDEAVGAVGYYTVALAPLAPPSGVPAGNGYLTLTLDNKGKAKVAGLLADGSTKSSGSSVVAILDGGDTLLVPVFVAKSPYCFGGTLRLVRGEGGAYVVDSSALLVWNNDNALLTYGGETGWRLSLAPVGGYYNTVDNLQAHYLTHAIGVSTATADKFLEEPLPAGCDYVLDIGPDKTRVALAGNALSTEKKALVKDGKFVDLEASVNPCNVQVKFTRATGIVGGSFSAWAESALGTTQKELTGFKHYGILLFSRGAGEALSGDVMTAGFYTQTAKIGYVDEKGRSKTRSYTASNPFNILAVDQGEPDWYADDWGERPAE